jgi:AraC-like DNA-binding protein
MVFARTGKTAARFILECRLAAAAVSLRSDTGARITAVALDAGFTDLSYFCRAFRRHFGVSARHYRSLP